MIQLPLTTPAQAAQYRAAGLWKDVTFFERFKTSALKHPDKTAIVQGARKRSYGELLDQVETLACNFLSLGLEPGDIVALQSPNAIEFPLVHLACNRAGLLFLPLHDSWRGPEIRHLLSQAEAKVVITPCTYRGFDHAAMIDDLRAGLPQLLHHFKLQEEGAERGFENLLTAAAAASDELDRRRPYPDLPAHIMLSGGTTSLSKMSLYSCNNLLAMLNNFVEAADLSEQDVAAALAPAGTGATGYIFPILTPLLIGATSIILERWSDPAWAVDLICEHDCTLAVGVPTQLARMIPVLETKALSDFERFRLFFNAGAPLARATGEAIEALMGCLIQSMYGSTDGGVPTTTRVEDPADKRLGTVGRVVRGCECHIWNEDGLSLSPGEVGEVVWRGADTSWGYLGDEAETARAFTSDGFYRSGDLGRFDPNGYLQIVGRLKDMILRGGRNISPLTIEEKLILHPAVEEVAVTGIPDEILGERACAFVTLQPGKVLSFDEVVAFLKQQELAVWQLPERLEVVGSLPRGPGGKVQKAKLRELVVQKMEADKSTTS